jgi:hypothetical protein
MSQLLEISEKSYYVWKKKTHTKLINLLESMYSKGDIDEYLMYGKISKFEILKDFEMILFGSKLDYIKFVNENLVLSLKYDLFTDLYYQFLVYMDKMQRSEDVEISKSWTVGDTIPGFFIKHSIAADKDDEIYKLQYKFGIVNDFDQNMSNFIRISLNRDMIPIVINNKLENMEFSEEYRQSAVHHVILFNIYKKYSTLTYQEKMLKLGEVYGFDLNNQSTDNFKKIISMPNGWKMAEIDIAKYLKKI